MATKIRLQRHGRKNYAYYHVVIADSRAPRDGKFVERLGSYNPNTNPATIEINFEKALKWVMDGAQPTDTVRNILSDEGVYMMKHLLGGVKKGAFDQAEAEKRFESWKLAKSTAIQDEKNKMRSETEANKKKRLQDEADKNKAKAAEIAAKKAKALDALIAESAPAKEEVAEVEEVVEEIVEAPVAEVVEETAAVVEEAPVVEEEKAAE